MKWILAFALLNAGFHSGQADAAQSAVIHVRAAYLYEKPDHRSPILTEIFEGDLIEVSSVPFTNVHGELWYRAKSRAKTTGFIPANDVMTAEFAEAEIKRGHDPYARRRNPSVDADPRWNSILIFQGLAMITVPPNTQGRFGGMTEWLANLGSKRPGFDSRRWALGGALLMTDNRRALMLSAVGRTFLERALGEPEIRIRLGRDFYSGSYLWSGGLAYRRPFLSHAKVESVPHWGWDIEIGGNGLLSSSPDPLQLGISIGFHKTFE